MSYELRVMSYKLQATSVSYKLRVMSYKLRVMSYKLQATGDELRATSYECELQVLSPLLPPILLHSLNLKNTPTTAEVHHRLKTAAKIRQTEIKTLPH